MARLADRVDLGAPGRFRRFALVVLAAAAGVVLSLWLLWQPKQKSAAADGYAKLGAPKLTSLSALPGSEISPALSPDGKRVAFAWNSEARDNFDIYVKLIGSTAPAARITTDPAPDLWPAWSPDSLRLAYVRDGAIYINSVNGGDERKITEANAGSIAWTADGRWIAAASGRTGIVLVRVKDGGKRWILHTGKDNYGDPFFALSADARKLILSRFVNDASADLLLSGDTEDVTRPIRRLTSHERPIYGIAWAESRSSLFYSEGRDAFSARLHRMAFDTLGNAKVEDLPFAGDHAVEPSVEISTPATRIAYTNIRVDSNLWYWKKGQEPRRILTWDSEESVPQLSPDASRVAFVSNKSGHEDIWICRIDGTEAKPAATLADARFVSLRWAPDGKSLAFAAERAGNRDIYVSALDGKAPRRLTTDASDESRPGWSADGHSVYFSSNRSGATEIWRAPAAGGTAEKITSDGGFEAVESSDGKFLYFTRANRPGLWRIRAGSKEQERVLYLIEHGYWALADHGVAYMDLPRLDDLPLRQRLLEFVHWGQKPATSIMFYDFDTRLVRKQRQTGEFVLRSRPGFSVSRDANSMVWAQVDSAESDLALLELRAP